MNELQDKLASYLRAKVAAPDLKVVDLARIPGGASRETYRFRARDLHLVLGPADEGKQIRFRVTIDGSAPAADHGADTDAEFDPTLLPQTPPKVKNATPEQQTRFNEGYNEFWKRLYVNDGNNPCADLFGGLKKAEDALKSSTYSFTKTRSGSPAETDGNRIDIHPNGLFMSKNDAAKFDVGANLPARQVYYVTLSNVEAAAFILAHEIGHRTRTLEPDGHDQSDFISALNNGKVRDACFSDIPTATRLF